MLVAVATNIIGYTLMEQEVSEGVYKLLEW